MEYNTIRTEADFTKKNNPISSVFPQGQFSDKRSNPYKNQESAGKVYLDKFNNPRERIKVMSYKNNTNTPLTTEVNKIFSDNSTYKPSKHMRVN